MKKVICMFAALMFSASAVYADTNVFFENRLVRYSDQTPVIVDSRTYIPIRDVFETMGYTVDWNAELKTVEISNDYYTVVLYTKTSGMFNTDPSLDPSYKRLENEIRLINGRTMLPLREILESMGYALDWDAETKSTYISDKNDYAYLEKHKKVTRELLNGADIIPAVPKDLDYEEKAFAKVLFSAADIDAAALFGGLSSENLQSRTAAIRNKKAALEAENCPDTMKTAKKNTIDMLDSLEKDINTLAAVNAANGGEEGAGATPLLTMRFGADKKAYEALSDIR